MKQTFKRAFTLVEIMIVVLIIGILVGIAVPNFIRARESARARTCIQNLRQIESAVQQFAMDNKLPHNWPHAFVIRDLAGLTYLGRTGAYLKSLPVCPSGGTYPDPLLNVAPTCTIGTSSTPAHVLP